ncbi:uncharacterized protein LOC105829941 isoform X1 [Monomorium pharaonis]|uniref:uncharacterized protein LOC105829941 isoform X1 n=1 Tax=Monomorium pharaonis TaxID=307658 RepID=UPI00063EFC2B|nr:uncharacterized protein LOC105829941 isoform X1 [Monomorium pharaonis]
MRVDSLCERTLQTNKQPDDARARFFRERLRERLVTSSAGERFLPVAAAADFAGSSLLRSSSATSTSPPSSSSSSSVGRASTTYVYGQPRRSTPRYCYRCARNGSINAARRWSGVETDGECSPRGCEREKSRGSEREYGRVREECGQGRRRGSVGVHRREAPQRTFLHHRSENIPYAYEYPNVAYPVSHSIEHSIGPSSKQLVVVSFIGLLLLLAIIQNTLSAVKRKDAIMDLLSSRQKRDVYATHDFRSVTPEEEEILNSDARVRCIQRTICLENRKLFRDLGAPGKMLAKYLTKDVEKSFKSSSGWDRLVRDAGAAGIRGENCDVLYRDCEIPVTKKRHKNVLTSIKDYNNHNSTY